MHNSRTLLRSGSLLLATIVASGTLAITTSALPAYADTTGTATDTTVADFTAGTTSATEVLGSDDGQVALLPTSNTDFSGSDLPLTWYSTQWGGLGGTSTVSGGQLTVDGALAHSYTTFDLTGLQSRTLDFYATFGAIPYQSAGFGLDLETDRHWILFSTNGDGTGLTTSVNNGAADPTTSALSGSYLGSEHHYRIVWNASSIVFSIDGTAVDTESVAINTPMRLSASDLALDGSSIGNGTVLKVNSMELSPYQGSFTSRVLDARPGQLGRILLGRDDSDRNDSHDAGPDRKHRDPGRHVERIRLDRQRRRRHHSRPVPPVPGGRDRRHSRHDQPDAGFGQRGVHGRHGRTHGDGAGAGRQRHRRRGHEPRQGHVQ